MVRGEPRQGFINIASQHWVRMCSCWLYALVLRRIMQWFNAHTKRILCFQQLLPIQQPTSQCLRLHRACSGGHDRSDYRCLQICGWCKSSWLINNRTTGVAQYKQERSIVASRLESVRGLRCCYGCELMSVIIMSARFCEEFNFFNFLLFCTDLP